MQCIILNATMALASSISLFAASAPNSDHILPYTIQPEPATDFSLDIEKTGLLKGKHHAVHFEKYKAELLYDVDNPIASKVRFVIEGASMTDTDEWLEQKNRERVVDYGENKMIEVARYPEITFVSTAATPVGRDEYQVTGSLTVHGVTKTESLSIKTRQLADGSFRFSGQARVNMREFGMEPPSTMMGAVGTKETMFVHFNLDARPAYPLAR